MQVRDRVKEFRRIRAGDLMPHPMNWRRHPDSQADALRGVLAQIGFADALVVREMPEGKYQLLDGHLRAETVPDMQVPVVVVDLDDGEASMLLVTHDPIAGMAEADADLLATLMEGLATDSDAVNALLTRLRVEHDVDWTIPSAEDRTGDEYDEQKDTYRVIIEGVRPDDRDRVLAAIQQAMKEGGFAYAATAV